MFKHGATIGPGGTMRPCCAWEDLPGTDSLRYEDNWYDRHLEWGKQSETAWLPQCEECKQSEDMGRESLRTEINEKLKYAEGIQYWDLKINNTCNLACRMCNAWSSSKWEQYSEVPGMIVTSGPKNKWHKQASGFLTEMLDAKEIKFTGGEPFLIPQVKTIIEKLIEYEIAPAVTLQFVTNGTQNMVSWCDMFKHFKQVKINVSIDAIGERYDYIRSHGNWEETERCVLEFKDAMPDNTGIWITCLEMILNKNNMWEVEEWSKQHGFNYVASGPILHPKWLKLDVFDVPEQHKIFVQQMEMMDNIHGTNWRDFVDEKVA